MEKKPGVSIVIPVLNEEESIADLLGEVRGVMSAIGKPYEVIVVDDGSTDNTYAVLRTIAGTFPELTVVRFSRNFGQTAALAAGFNTAQGEYVISMDGDGQNDPHDIPHLLVTAQEGYDIVSGWRFDRQDRFVMRILPSRIANGLISFVTRVKLHDYGCTLKVYKKNILDQLRLYGEMHRFIPALARWYGARITEARVHHRPRTKGKSKYDFSRTRKVILDLITVSFLLNFLTKPIQIFGFWGLIFGGLGFCIGVYLTLLKLFAGADLIRPLLLLCVLLILVGIQLISIGLLGELIVRIYYEAQKKPIYYIREKIGASE